MVKIQICIKMLEMVLFHHYSSIYNKDRSKVGFSLLCSNPCYIYYYFAFVFVGLFMWIRSNRFNTSWMLLHWFTFIASLHVALTLSKTRLLIFPKLLEAGFNFLHLMLLGKSTLWSFLTVKDHKVNFPNNIIIRNIPTSIQKRLTTISSSENEFMEAWEEYQKALKDAGYSEELKYEPEEHQKLKRKQNRRMKIIWFNPPCSKNVATNIEKEFFGLIRIHFPKQHPFNRLFNKLTVKLSYFLHYQSSKHTTPRY